MQLITRAGVAVFIWRDGKFLLMQRWGSHGEGTWSVPGGHLEFGESWEEVARREASEETGVEIKNVRLLAVTNDIFPDHSKHFVSIWMQADWADVEPQILEPKKCKGMKWCTIDELPENLFQPCWGNLKKAKPELFA